VTPLDDGDAMTSSGPLSFLDFVRLCFELDAGGRNTIQLATTQLTFYRPSFVELSPLCSSPCTVERGTAIGGVLGRGVRHAPSLQPRYATIGNELGIQIEVRTRLR
jgi:hypothetical protein